MFVMVDQLMPHLTSTYGHDVVETPNLDRLAADGIRFDAAYTPNPVCGPARACVMTGRHCSEIEAWDNATPLSDDEVTYAHYARDRGYDTVLSGKMHFVGADQLHGFDRRFTTDIYPEDFRWTQPRAVDDLPNMELAQQYIGDAIHVDRSSQYISYDEETHFRSHE
jgi:choline-sulfatase